MKLMSKLIVVFAAVSLASCGGSTADKVEASTSPHILVKDPIFEGKYAPVKDKIDVYNSIARAVKYNADAAVVNMKDKVLDDGSADPKGVLQGLINAQNSGENPLYTGIRSLDYAIIYAASNLSDAPEFVRDNLYQKASQNLAKAAIKSHKDALFSLNKIKEIERVFNREGGDLSKLNDKLEREGRLSEEELELKKGLEVSVFKLSELRKAFSLNVANYAQLVKVDSLEKLSLEGRKFYELEDFDKSLTIEVFQQSAFKNRDEFAISAKRATQSFADVKASLFRKYPEAERLQINGHDVGSPMYVRNLEARSGEIANHLIDKVIKFRRSNDAADKEAALEELNAAILSQIEISYGLIYAADADLKDVNDQISQLKKEVLVKDNKYRLAASQKVELLDVKIKLLENEAQASQILGERAMAIRSLYFYAGFSPFTRRFLLTDVKEIARGLKVGFNQDAVEMLASVPALDKKEKDALSNDWAKKDNWLEALMEKKYTPKEQKVENPKGVFEPYVGDIYNQKRIMQLGSYSRKDSADLEWSMLVEIYPELAELEPKVEKIRDGGKVFYRLVVVSAKGGMQPLCNQLRRDKVECILK